MRACLAPLCALVLLAAFAALPGEARAQTLVETQPAFRPRVALAVPSFRIYADPTLPATQTGIGAVSLPEVRRAVERFVDADPRWAVPERGAAVRLVEQARDDVQADLVTLARQGARLGIGSYEAYHLRTAIDELHQATETWASTVEPWLEPGPIADAWLYLALAWNALGLAGDTDPVTASAHVDAALREMVRLDPLRVLDRNTWPSAVVEAWQAAYLGLLLDDAGGLGLQRDDAQWLAERLDVDTIAWGWVAVRSDGAVLHLQLWDAPTQRFILDARVPVGADTAETVARIEAELSKLVACTPALPPPPIDEVPHDAGTTWVGGGPSSAVFLSGPSRRRFLHVGMVLDATHMITDVAGVYGALRLMTSLPDPDGDVISRIDTQRAEVGGLVAWRGRRGRLYAGGGIELARIGAVRATTSFWCKVSEGEPLEFDAQRECDDEDVQNSPGLANAGVAFRAGGAVRVAGPVWLDLRTSATLYFAPVSDRELDAPISVDLGLLYRF